MFFKLGKGNMNQDCECEQEAKNVRKIYLEIYFKIQQLGLENTTDTFGILYRIHLFIYFISDVSGRYIMALEDISDRALHKSTAVDGQSNKLGYHWVRAPIGKREGMCNEVVLMRIKIVALS